VAPTRGEAPSGRGETLDLFDLRFGI
jgi:hypothetical protein